jgi:hypothetical protein
MPQPGQRGCGPLRRLLLRQLHRPPQLLRLPLRHRPLLHRRPSRRPLWHPLARRPQAQDLLRRLPLALRLRVLLDLRAQFRFLRRPSVMPLRLLESLRWQGLPCKELERQRPLRGLRALRQPRGRSDRCRLVLCEECLCVHRALRGKANARAARALELRLECVPQPLDSLGPPGRLWRGRASHFRNVPDRVLRLGRILRAPALLRDVRRCRADRASAQWASVPEVHRQVARPNQANRFTNASLPLVPGRRWIGGLKRASGSFTLCERVLVLVSAALFARKPRLRLSERHAR